MGDVPIVLFGAFDRHNLGDFLLGRAAALAAGERPCLFAGLRSADLTACGGFVVEALPAIVADWRRRYGDTPLELVHVGGEILDTDAWEAAVMLLEPERSREVVARFDPYPGRSAAWAAGFLASTRAAPYVVGRDEIPVAARVEFRTVGGAGLARRDPAFRAEVAAALQSAERLSVRDRRTQAALAVLGVAAELAPDPATALGPWLRQEIAAVPAVGEDYLAIQCAASFGDDASLDALAAAIDAQPCPVAIFRAGAAPWHDDLAVCERLAQRLKGPARVLASLHIREICATIARARLCLASSLHAVLVAGVFGIPALGLERRPGEGEKLRAYAETWGGFDITTPFTAKLLKDKIYKT